VAVGLAREVQLAPPPYDEIADALVELGWERENPVLIAGGAHELSYLGSAYAVRGPVSWYLPGHPRLVLADESDCLLFYALLPGEPLRPTAVSTRVAGVDLFQAPCSPFLQGFTQGRDGAFLFETER
ncbi:MAG TPA: hypothetical protein VJ744_03000, partial [Gaiellaceae bacterium]|nr:hypothetical protein [Gaiellaceae bacterium]